MEWGKGMRLLVLAFSSKVVRPRLGVESREVWLCAVDEIQSSEVGRPRTVEVEEQRVDGIKVRGEVAKMFSLIGEAVAVSRAFDIKQ